MASWIGKFLQVDETLTAFQRRVECLWTRVGMDIYQNSRYRFHSKRKAIGGHANFFIIGNARKLLLRLWTSGTHHIRMQQQIRCKSSVWTALQPKPVHNTRSNWFRRTWVAEGTFHTAGTNLEEDNHHRKEGGIDKLKPKMSP